MKLSAVGRKYAEYPAFIVIMALAFSTTLSADSANDIDFFEIKIRPILVERCESCHSAAKGKTNGGLALDTRHGWTNGGESGSPIVPGKPEESLLLRAVSYVADGPQMPPSTVGGKLSDVEIEALREWIARGAADPRTAVPRTLAMTPEEARTWWSFQNVRVIDPPTVKTAASIRSDIDRFILRELEARNFAVAEPADKRTLIRRATFDVTGLPPTPAEIEEFVNDPSALAFDRVVNRLLDSPAYGQRWARHWLDVARYADFYDANPKTRTASCELTEAWRYRDWVVDSFNSDLPYDLFIKHQIAGDQLPNPTGEEVYPAGLIATTFLSNGVWDRGDADKEKIISDMADDNIDTVGKAFLGLTLGCARCHDHKFDPVSTEDYYALAGIFYSSHILKDLGAKGAEYVMNRVPLVSPAVLREREKQESRLKEAESQLESLDQRKRHRELTAGGSVLVPTQFLGDRGSTGIIASDGVITVNRAESQNSYTVKALAPDGDIRFVRLETICDPSLPGNGPGNASHGIFVINRFALSFSPPGTDESSTPVTWASAKADFEQKGFTVAGAIDEKPETGWSAGPGTGKNHVAVFEVSGDMKIPQGATLTFTIDQTRPEKQALGKFRLSVASLISTAVPDDEPARSELISTRDRIKNELSTPVPVAMAVTEGGMPGGLFPQIQDVPIHIRGSYAKLGSVVPRRMPRFLAGHDQAPITNGSGRRELANWVTSNDNPLTARVIVNRIWQWHFGEGLVRTPSNFGKLGEAPTHPELLDWLARTLMDDGWSLKKLHARIMLSAVYQQSSRVARDIVARDPENIWLGRFSSRRIEAEAIRDAMLSVAGQLDGAAGGPADDDFTSRRRSLYVQTARWDRSGYAMLFDAANPDSSTEKRVVSIVAPQALLFLNHEFILSQARHLARRLANEVPHDDAARIQRAYQLLFGRAAVEEELEIATGIVRANTAESRDGWIDLAHILLCSNEFVYLD